jgi:hypothetical protein
MEKATVERADDSEREGAEGVREPSMHEMPCPICGHPMPDLKGGKETICPVCGFKDSCCY